MTLVGRTLGEFEILDRLGQGGMGAVYKARQLSLKRLVALKTLQNAFADDGAYIARFRQEAIAAAALNHPNLVQVFSAGESDGLHWFSMEYVEGESARARLQREVRIEPREAINIAICVVTALQYGWRKATLIHRDIKPDNIFLSRDGEVKLGDLGLAKSGAGSHGLTSTGHSLGTPYYISPEQAQDSKSVDFRADIYSLGCTLYHMVVGKPPFEGSSGAAILLKHITQPAPSLRAAWPQCPLPLSEIVEKMMQKDPDDRQQDHEELLGDLRHAYAAVGAHATPAPTVRPAPATAPTARPGSIPAASDKRSGTYEIDADLAASSMSGLGAAPPGPAASGAAGTGHRSGAYEIDPDLAASPGSASKVSVDSGYIPMEDLHRSGTYEIDSKLDASSGASLPVRPGAVWPGTDPAADGARSGTYEINADLKSSVQPGQPAAPAPPAQPGAIAPPPSSVAGTGQLRLVPPVDYDSKPKPTGPIIIPPTDPAGNPLRPGAAQKSFPVGKIAVALLIIIGALYYYFSHHGNKSFVAATPDDPAEASNPESVWHDWMQESRRDGYFLYHRELIDHQVEVTFQKRAATVTNNTFRNGKIRARCIVPPANSAADYVQFYVRQIRDAKGYFRRYEAHLTRDSIVFSLNDSAQGVHEITHWSIPPTPPLPIIIFMEIEAKKNHFTVSLNDAVIGTAHDDTLPGAGTFGIDAPAETHLMALSFMDLDPPESAAPSPGAPAAK